MPANNLMNKGRARGLEPPNGGATSRCLNHLATPAVVRCQCTNPTRLPFHLPVAPRSGWWLWALAAGLLGGGLVLTNPPPSDFEHFAAEQLVEVIEPEVCRGEVLPSLVRLALRDCSRLIRAQRGAIGAYVSDHTRRTNLGLLSIYRTELGGTSLLGWSLPRFTATVVAFAGQLVILQAGLDEEPS